MPVRRRQAGPETAVSVQNNLALLKAPGQVACMKAHEEPSLSSEDEEESLATEESSGEFENDEEEEEEEG